MARGFYPIAPPPQATVLGGATGKVGDRKDKRAQRRTLARLRRHWRYPLTTGETPVAPGMFLTPARQFSITPTLPSLRQVKNG
jgi:hypothetical protein